MSESNQQHIEIIPADALLERVRQYRQQGWRFVQVSTTRLPDQVQLTYSFDKESRLENLRLSLPPVEARPASISSIYWAAMLYENELQDLFNVRVEGMSIDFGGKFYNMTVKHPSGTAAVPPVKAAAAPAAAKPAAASQPATVAQAVP